MELEIIMLSEIIGLRKTNITCFLLCVELDLKLHVCVNVCVEDYKTRKIMEAEKAILREVRNIRSNGIQELRKQEAMAGGMEQSSGEEGGENKNKVQ